MRKLSILSWKNLFKKNEKSSCKKIVTAILTIFYFSEKKSMKFQTENASY